LSLPFCVHKRRVKTPVVEKEPSDREQYVTMAAPEACMDYQHNGELRIIFVTFTKWASETVWKF
jgi:hypothetical protein